MKNRPPILPILLGMLLLTVFSTVYADHGRSRIAINSHLYTSTPPSITNITICNNQLPYQWNGLTCVNAGTYTAILTAANGTDSTAILNLSVNNVGTSITNVVVCDNQLPYHWNGNSYSGSGTYSVTLTSSNGCDSVPILSLTVNHQVNSTTSAAICSNQIPYSWNGNSYTTAGQYQVTLTSTAGCDSIATLFLIIKPVSTSITNKVVCSNRLPYFWNGNAYPAAGSYQLTLTGSNGCDSVATLNLSTIPVTGSTTSVTVCSNQLPYSWNGQSYSTIGNHPVILTGVSGCDSIATLVLTIKPVLQSISNIIICNGQLPYTWNGNSYATGGNYQVTLTASNGCDSIAKLNLVSVPFLTSNNPVTACSTELPYVWNGIPYSTAGNYTASFVNSAGCDSIATLLLSIEDLQLVNGDVILCSDQLPYLWNGYVFPAAGTYPINPPIVVDACHSISSFTVALSVPASSSAASVCSNQLPYIWHGSSYNAAGIYTVTLPGITGCDTLATLYLSVHPVTSDTSNINICSDQLPFSWNGHYYTATGIYPVMLTSASGCDSLKTLNLVVNPVKSSTTNIVICNTQLPFSWNGNAYTAPGLYSITLSSSNGCDSLVTLNLGVQSVLTSTTNIAVCNNQLPYLWNGNSYSNAGVYSFATTGSGGCDSVATLNLSINNIVTGDTTIHVCNTLLPFSWNGNSYPMDGNYSVMLISSTGCDSLANLHLFVDQAVSSLTTVYICNNQLPYNWNGNSYPGTGNYTLLLTSSSGCDSIATLHLEVTDILTSTTNVTICTAQLPYTWNGNSYPLAGTYSVTLASPGGCDSVPILSLTVVPYFTGATNVSVCNNLLPFDWHGQSYNTAGIYHDTIPAQSGCDSIVSLNLSVRPVQSHTDTIRICNNQLPFLWNGNSYNTAGLYFITLAGMNGCDSIAGLFLIVNQVTNSSTVVSVCSNLLPYNWNGNSYTAAGNYTIILTGSNGCDSTAILSLSVRQPSASTTTLSICPAQLPYSWNGHLFNSAGIFTAILQNIAGCDSLATINLSVLPIAVSTSNASACANELPFSWNGQSYTTAGNHTVILTSAAGCDSLATLDLSILPVSVSLTSATTCINQLPYTWNGQVYSAAGNYSVTLTGISGCDSVATLRLTVNPVSTSITQVTACSAQLPYVWNGQPYTTAGMHTVTLTSFLGCDSVATLKLSIVQSPLAPSVQSPVTYCQYDATTALSAIRTDSLAQLTWYNAPTGGTGSPTAPTPSSAVAGSYNFYVSQFAGICEGPRILLTVRVNSKPSLGADKSLKLCFGAITNLNSLYPLNNYTTSSWTQGSLPVHNPTSIGNTGTYQLIVMNNTGCIDTAQVAIHIQPLVIAHAGPDDNAEPNVPYQLSGSGNGTYQWSPSNLLNDADIANPLATISANTSFVLIVKDEIGCFARDTINLRVLDGPTFYVPTAFTPNGDGENDIFRPSYVGISSLDFFRIYNRYGELVYETRQMGQGWDGVYKGIKQNTGNFVWFIKATDRKGQVKVKRGNMLLIR